MKEILKNDRLSNIKLFSNMSPQRCYSKYQSDLNKVFNTLTYEKFKKKLFNPVKIQEFDLFSSKNQNKNFSQEYLNSPSMNLMLKMKFNESSFKQYLKKLNKAENLNNSRNKNINHFSSNNNTKFIVYNSLDIYKPNTHCLDLMITNNNALNENPIKKSFSFSKEKESNHNRSGVNNDKNNNKNESPELVNKNKRNRSLTFKINKENNQENAKNMLINKNMNERYGKYNSSNVSKGSIILNNNSLDASLDKNDFDKGGSKEKNTINSNLKIKLPKISFRSKDSINTNKDTLNSNSKFLSAENTPRILTDKNHKKNKRITNRIPLLIEFQNLPSDKAVSNLRLSSELGKNNTPSLGFYFPKYDLIFKTPTRNIYLNKEDYNKNLRNNRKFLVNREMYNYDVKADYSIISELNKN